MAAARNMNEPGWIFYYLTLAMNYGQLGRNAEARESVEKLLELYPDYGTHARTELRKWIWEEEAVQDLVAGMREAGLDIPPEEPKGE